MTRRPEKPRQGGLFHQSGEAPERSAARWLERVRAEFSVFASDEGVSEIRMLNGVEKPRAAPRGSGGSAGLIRRASEQIEEYLEGARRRFELKTDLSSLTPFMAQVLGRTAEIPYGETRSYGWVAKRIGKPGASRAVGQALHGNPVPLVVP